MVVDDVPLGRGNRQAPATFVLCFGGRPHWSLAVRPTDGKVSLIDIRRCLAAVLNDRRRKVYFSNPAEKSSVFSSAIFFDGLVDGIGNYEKFFDV